MEEERPARDRGLGPSREAVSSTPARGAGSDLGLRSSARRASRRLLERRRSPRRGELGSGLPGVAATSLPLTFSASAASTLLPK